MLVTRAALLSLVVTFAAHAQCPPALSAPPSYAYGNLLELDDFNDDGNLDALTTVFEEPLVRLNLGTSRGTFRRGADIELTDIVRGSAIGDFNGDGRLDAMLAGGFGDAIHLLAGRGDGTFDAPRTVTTSSDPWALHGDDLDGDGNLDLIVANLTGDVDVRWGRGDGTFEAAALTFNPAFYPSLLATGDMNEDGRNDIIIGHEQGAITVTTIGPDRTAGTPFRANMAGFVFGMKVRDLDGDGHLDVIAADPIEFAVAFFKGNGDGTLRERVDIPAGAYTEGIDSGDFNGDGRTDIVVGQSVEEKLAILYREPDGSFSAPVEHLAGHNVYDVRVADVDHDGDDDVVAANIASFAVLLQQSGRGEFPQAESMSLGANLGPYDILAADLNGDALADIVTANTLHNTLSVFLGNPDGTLQESSIYFSGDDGPYRVVAADLNGDQHLDLAAVNVFENTLGVLHGRGDGTFHSAVKYPTGTAPSALSHGDIDADGDGDLLVSSPEDGVVNVFLNAGNGTFTRGIDIAAGAPGQTLLTDLNADGKVDLALVDLVDPVEPVTGHLTIRNGNGDGTFGAPVNYPVGVRPIDLATHDFNRDGHLDFAVANFDFGTITILLHDNTAGYRPVNELQNFGATPHLTIADFNLDGHADIATANSGLVVIHESRGNGQFAPPTTHRAGNTPFSITSADLNRDGRPDLLSANIYSADISILRNLTACRQRAVRK
jgi:FG-GAP-like repeat